VWIRDHAASKVASPFSCKVKEFANRFVRAKKDHAAHARAIERLYDMRTRAAEALHDDVRCFLRLASRVPVETVLRIAAARRNNLGRKRTVVERRRMAEDAARAAEEEAELTPYESDESSDEEEEMMAYAGSAGASKSYTHCDTADYIIPAWS
jgi:hypothetical protein